MSSLTTVCRGVFPLACSRFGKYFMSPVHGKNLILVGNSQPWDLVEGCRLMLENLAGKHRRWKLFYSTVFSVPRFSVWRGAWAQISQFWDIFSYCRYPLPFFLSPQPFAKRTTTACKSMLCLSGAWGWTKAENLGPSLIPPKPNFHSL